MRRTRGIGILAASLGAIAALAPAVAHADRVTEPRPWKASNEYYVRESLDGRAAPKLEPRAKVDHVRAGQWVRIECQTTGESAYGSTVWDKVGGLYVPDRYIRTYTTGFISGAPRCKTTTPPPPRPLRYGALGDSYSSGEGAYMDGGTYDAGHCHKSSHAYPFEIKRRLGISDANFRFQACSGDVVNQVKAQISGFGSRSLDLVTVSVMGNDVGFRPIIEKCVLSRCTSADLRKVDDALKKPRKRPPSRSRKTPRENLRHLYTMIQKRMAKGGRVVVVGYPRLFSLAECDGTRIRVLVPGVGGPKVVTVGTIDVDEQRLLNRAADQLNNALRADAKWARFRFANPTPTFAGHRLCEAAPGLRGLNSVFERRSPPTPPPDVRDVVRWFKARLDDHLQEIVHPNRLGHQRYAEVVWGQVR